MPGMAREQRPATSFETAINALIMGGVLNAAHAEMLRNAHQHELTAARRGAYRDVFKAAHLSLQHLEDSEFAG